MNVGEVAASSARDEDLLAGAICVLEYRDAEAALAGFDRAHQSGGASTHYDRVETISGHPVSMPWRGRSPTHGKRSQGWGTLYNRVGVVKRHLSVRRVFRFCFSLRRRFWCWCCF